MLPNSGCLPEFAGGNANCRFVRNLEISKFAAGFLAGSGVKFQVGRGMRTGFDSLFRANCALEWTLAIPLGVVGEFVLPFWRME